MHELAFKRQYVDRKRYSAIRCIMYVCRIYGRCCKTGKYEEAIPTLQHNEVCGIPLVQYALFLYLLKIQMMANTTNNPLLQGLSGKIGALVIKQYGNKTVVCKKPDMSRVKKTARQLANNALFAEAAAYAKAICADAAQKKVYALKTRPGQSVYHYAIQEFFRLRKG